MSLLSQTGSNENKRYAAGETQLTEVQHFCSSLTHQVYKPYQFYLTHLEPPRACHTLTQSTPRLAPLCPIQSPPRTCCNRLKLPIPWILPTYLPCPLSFPSRGHSGTVLVIILPG